MPFRLLYDLMPALQATAMVDTSENFYLDTHMNMQQAYLPLLAGYPHPQPGCKFFRHCQQHFCEPSTYLTQQRTHSLD